MDCGAWCMYLLVFLCTVDVTLDADTANKQLIISEDLKTVHCGLLKQKKEACPERFSDTLCVLGLPRFTSGRHYWEVDVESSREWDVGVCKESVHRQGMIQLSPDRGFWTVSLRRGQFYSAGTVPSTVLRVNPRLHRVGIFLDLNSRSISFYHISDGSHIFTFTKLPTAEPLRPFFSPGSATRDAQCFLRICPVVNLGIDSPPANPGSSKWNSDYRNSDGKSLYNIRPWMGDFLFAPQTIPKCMELWNHSWIQHKLHQGKGHFHNE